jgi:hypothetical protein
MLITHVTITGPYLIVDETVCAAPLRRATYPKACANRRKRDRAKPRVLNGTADTPSAVLCA